MARIFGVLAYFHLALFNLSPAVGFRLDWASNTQCLRDLLETGLTCIQGDLGVQIPQSHLLPRRRLVMMPADEVIGQRKELRLACALGAVVAAVELANVQKRHDQKVERA